MSANGTGEREATDLHDLLDRPIANYVGGEWTRPGGGVAETVVDPAAGETLGETPNSTESEVDAAVGVADEAFEEWRQTPVEERIQPLFRFKSLLEEHQSAIAELLVREHGKTRAEAEGELRRGIENVEVACGVPTTMQAGHLPHAAPDIDETAVRQPLGTVVAVTPFNFPAMIPLWFLPYAVATGNTFVLKPSERDPFTPNRIAELVDEAGFPDGVVNVVHGGPDTVNRL
ncbi:MAG: aldehyde dehydrogenase family protein, partial [Natrialbaceae archaeon]